MPRTPLELLILEERALNAGTAVLGLAGAALVVYLAIELKSDSAFVVAALAWMILGTIYFSVAACRSTEYLKDHIRNTVDEFEKRAATIRSTSTRRRRAKDAACAVVALFCTVCYPHTIAAVPLPRLFFAFYVGCTFVSIFCLLELTYNACRSDAAIRFDMDARALAYEERAVAMREALGEVHEKLLV